MDQQEKPQRLCSEIQLFDICELDVCSHRHGRYCTKGDILARFEAIHEGDDRTPEQFFAEELDEVEHVVGVRVFGGIHGRRVGHDRLFSASQRTLFKEIFNG